MHNELRQPIIRYGKRVRHHIKHHSGFSQHRAAIGRRRKHIQRATKLQPTRLNTRPYRTSIRFNQRPIRQPNNRNRRNNSSWNRPPAATSSHYNSNPSRSTLSKPVSSRKPVSIPVPGSGKPAVLFTTTLTPVRAIPSVQKPFTATRLHCNHGNTRSRHNRNSRPSRVRTKTTNPNNLDPTTSPVNSEGDDEPKNPTFSIIDQACTRAQFIRSRHASFVRASQNKLKNTHSLEISRQVK